MSTLPPLCYARRLESGRTILIVHGEDGYHPVESMLTPEQRNSALREVPTALQVEAMPAGCVFGWDVPAADPALLRQRHGGFSWPHCCCSRQHTAGRCSTAILVG